MFVLSYTTQFAKDIKLIKKRSIKDIAILQSFITNLSKTGVKGIARKHVPHRLKGSYSDCWECHVKPDLLLIWIESETKKEIILVRTGTHSDLF